MKRQKGGIVVIPSENLILFNGEITDTNILYIRKHIHLTSIVNAPKGAGGHKHLLEKI
jgi:hypothetical protein